MEKILNEINKKLTLNNQLKYQILMSNIISNLDFENKKDKEILLLLLQDRDRNFVRINHNKECFENIKKYLKLLRPIHIDEQKLMRIGGRGDGGYVMFNEGCYMNKTALSFGVSEYSPWDLEMAKMGARVIEYDASIEKSPYEHKNIIFHKKFIGTNNNENFITFEQVLKDNGIKTDGNILQCDIENAEWEMLENMDLDLLSNHFSQVIFEFHGCNPEEEQGIKYRSRILEKLNKAFVPFHLHFNNHGKIWYSNGLFFSTTIEVSYINKKFIDLSTIQLKDIIKNPKYDSPCNPSSPEIPIRL